MCERCGRRSPGYCGCSSGPWHLTKDEQIRELEDRIKTLKEGE